METPFQNDASAQTFVNWISVSSEPKVWIQSRTLFQDAGSLLGVFTKEFTSCGATSFSVRSFSFVVNLSEVNYFSFDFRPNSSHQLETAPKTLSWFAEWIVRNKSSVFEASALKCMVSLLLFSEFHDLSTDALEYWMIGLFESFHHLCGDRIPSSFRCFIVSSIPLPFVSRTEKRPVPVRESFRVFLDFSEFKYKFLHFLFLSNRCRWTLTWRWSGLRIPKVRCSVFATHSGSLEESAMTQVLGKYWTRTQSVLHRFQIILCMKQWKCFNLIFPSSICFWVFWHCSQAWEGIREDVYFCLRPIDHLIVRKCIVDLAHERDVQSIGVTFRISAWWSNINLCVISNKFWTSSKFVFLYTSEFSM